MSAKYEPKADRITSAAQARPGMTTIKKIMAEVQNPRPA
jgi:hypothetical protein